MQKKHSGLHVGVSTKFKAKITIASSSHHIATSLMWKGLDDISTGVLEVSMIDPTSFRLRGFLAIAVAAVLVAAALRHTLHVYAGFSREEIGWDALSVAIIAILAILFFRRASKQ